MGITQRRGRSMAAVLAVMFGATVLFAPNPAFAVETTVTAASAGDAQVSSGSPAANYGTSTKMGVCAACPEPGSPTKRGYARFTVDVGAGSVTAAVLRVYATNAPVPRIDVHQVSSNWSESTITWTNAPSPGSVVGTTPGGASIGYYDIPIDPGVIQGDGTYAFALSMAVTGTVARLGTKEASAATRPLLLVTTDDGAPPPPPPPPPPGTGPLAAVPDSTVSPNYAAGPLGRASAIVEANGRIYIGGDFRTVGGATRNFLAAINSQTGGLDPNWNPNANGRVEALAVGPDGSIYAGGVFTTVGGASRARLARLDPVTGAAMSWNPGTSSEVRALAVANGRVFAGGSFSTVGGVARLSLAAIDAGSGAVISTWSANTSSVRDIEASPDGDLIYVGGNFTMIGGTSRRFLAAISTVTGTVSPWTPTVPYLLYDVAVSTDGTRVYTAGGGPFANGGNQAGAYDTARNGAPLWDTQSDGDYQAIEVRGSVVYGGGHFNMVANQRRNHIVALDASNGSVMSWNPSADSTWGVFRLKRGANSLLVGGDFARIGGRQQPHFARFSPA